MDGKISLSIYQHFRKHEHPFVDQVLSWKQQVEQRHKLYLTDFLDPREQQIVSSLIGAKHDDIHFSLHGGIELAERKRAIIAPFYEQINEQLFEVILLGATYPSKFMTLSHRDILGACMSLGIDRKKLGDIYVDHDEFHLIVTKDIVPFLKMHLTKINQATIKLDEKSFRVQLKNKDVWEKSTHIVSSLRLDILVKEIYRISRKQAVTLIKENRVKVNFTEVDEPAMQVIENDLLSVRGFGRSKVIEINGKTRKNKIIITSAKLKTR